MVSWFGLRWLGQPLLQVLLKLPKLRQSRKRVVNAVVELEERDIGELVSKPGRGVPDALGLRPLDCRNSPRTARSTSAPHSGFTSDRIIMTFIGCTTFRCRHVRDGGTHRRFVALGFVLQLLRSD
jgi:hypothetical protein